VKWFYYEQSWQETSAKRGSELDDDVVFSITSSTDAMRENATRVVTDLLQYVLFSVNLSDQADTAEKLEALLNEGRKFNRWT
jgi:hypothetical protein